MSEDQNQAAPVVDEELEALKTQAREAGIKFHPAISKEKLLLKLATASEGGGDDEELSDEPVAAKPTLDEIKAEATKLVRIRIACMNPAKKHMDAELFCTGNMYIGTVKKLVPFDTEWHVPQCILDMIQQRKCQIFSDKVITRSDGVRVKTRKGKLIKEFAVEILPDLSEKELKALAQRQAMAAGTAEA